MKPDRVVSLLCALGAAVLAACRSKAHEPGHAAEPVAAARPAPTPDYTPIPLLRTPAGLVLGVEQPIPPTPPAAPPEGTPLPQPTAAPSP